MRNYGQHNALLCGIRAAQYDVIVTMDDDLQHPPEEIPRLLEQLQQGFDVVYGAPEAERHPPLRALALAPLAVWPERQGQGIGSALVHAGLEQADRGAWDAVFVLGAPRFYERFGFSAEAAKGFSCPYGGEEFMARFRGVEAASRAGRLGYPLAFGALEP